MDRENRLRGGVVFGQRLGLALFGALIRKRQGQQLLTARLLRHGGDKLGIANVCLVNFALFKAVQHVVHNVVRVLNAHGLSDAGIIGQHLEIALGIVFLRFFAHCDHARALVRHLRGSQLQNIGVIAARKAAVAPQ